MPDISSLADPSMDGAEVTITGRLSDVSELTTKQGRTWATATLTDPSGVLELMLYPKFYEAYRQRATDGARVTVSGRVDQREEGVLRFSAVHLEACRPRLAKLWWTYGPTFQWRPFRLYGEPPNGRWTPIRITQIVGGRSWSISITRTEPTRAEVSRDA